MEVNVGENHDTGRWPVVDGIHDLSNTRATEATGINTNIICSSTGSKYERQIDINDKNYKNRDGARSRSQRFTKNSQEGQINIYYKHYENGTNNRTPRFIKSITQRDGTQSPVKRKDIPKIFVGNLPDLCTVDDLRNLFKAYGTITECSIMKERHYGFVHMETVEEAKEAISKLQNSMLKGKLITVEHSSSKYHTKAGTSGYLIAKIPQNFERSNTGQQWQNGMGSTTNETNKFPSQNYLLPNSHSKEPHVLGQSYEFTRESSKPPLQSNNSQLFGDWQKNIMSSQIEANKLHLHNHLMSNAHSTKHQHVLGQPYPHFIRESSETSLQPNNTQLFGEFQTNRIMSTQDETNKLHPQNHIIPESYSSEQPHMSGQYYQHFAGESSDTPCQSSNTQLLGEWQNNRISTDGDTSKLQLQNLLLPDSYSEQQHVSGQSYFTGESSESSLQSSNTQLFTERQANKIESSQNEGNKLQQQNCIMSDSFPTKSHYSLNQLYQHFGAKSSDVPLYSNNIQLQYPTSSMGTQNNKASTLLFSHYNESSNNPHGISKQIIEGQKLSQSNVSYVGHETQNERQLTYELNYYGLQGEAPLEQLMLQNYSGDFLRNSNHLTYKNLTIPPQDITKVNMCTPPGLQINEKAADTSFYANNVAWPPLRTTKECTSFSSVPHEDFASVKTPVNSFVPSSMPTYSTPSVDNWKSDHPIAALFNQGVLVPPII